VTTTKSRRPYGRISLPSFGLPRKSLRAVYEFRRGLERQAIAKGIELTQTAHSRIHSACCCLAEVFAAHLRLSTGGLTVDQQCEEWNRIRDANERRSRVLAKIVGLDPAKPAKEDPWTMAQRLLDQQMAQAGPPAAPKADRRLASHPGDSGAP
jgi:hypothetical protein